MNSPVVIAVRGVEKSFGSQKVLECVDIDIRKGESLVIIGPSGCGKSVLLRHLIGLHHPDEGSIRIDGTDIAHMKRSELYAVRRKFGMLFQNSALFDSMTVGENVTLGLKEHFKPSDEELRVLALKQLELVGLVGAIDKKPSELSGGMRKRAALARALAMDPEIILYDEPTTGLDPIMADVINELIRSLQERFHTTSITVTHDMVSAYKVADRIAMLHNGRIIFDGTPDEVRSTDNEHVQQFIRGEAVGPIQTV